MLTDADFWVKLGTIVLKPSFQAIVIQHLQRDPLTQLLSQLTRAEQLQVIMEHPFFTGHCPQCQHEFDRLASVPNSPADWQCPYCGWMDDFDQALSKTTQQNDPITNRAEVKRLGNYLVEADLITQAQVDDALAAQAATGMRLGEVLVQRGWINQQTIEYLMAKIILPERQ